MRLIFSIFRGLRSERPRSLLLSLGGAIQTLAWVRSWARPGPIPGPKGSRPDSPCALFYSISIPSRSQDGGHPGLVPSVPSRIGLDGPKQTSWPLPIRVVISEHNQLSQAIPQFHVELMFHERTPITRNLSRNTTDAGSLRINLCFGGEI